MDSILYSIGDKGIYDAILQGIITKDHLEDIFLSRGIIISHKTERKVLARYFSRFPHSYEDFLRLSNILGTTSQREKLTYFHIKTSVDINEFDESIELLKEHLEEHGDATCSYKKTSEDNYNITINYKVHNFNKSEFRQITNKDALIEVVRTEDNLFLIRHPNNKDVKGYVNYFVQEVSKKSVDIFEIRKINLQRYLDSRTKTAFLERLIISMNGLELHDVIDVYVYHPKNSLAADDLEDDLEDEEDKFDKVETTSGTHISKASLKGVGILESDEINQLYAKDFYLYRIIWQSKVRASPDSDIYEFEATFTDPEKMTDFSYIVKGYLKYKGNREYAKSRTQPSQEESAWLNELIEKAAHTSMNYIESLEDVDCKN